MVNLTGASGQVHKGEICRGPVPSGDQNQKNTPYTEVSAAHVRPRVSACGGPPPISINGQGSSIPLMYSASAMMPRAQLTNTQFGPRLYPFQGLQ